MNRRLRRRPFGVISTAGALALVLVGCGTVIDDARLEEEIRNGVQSQAGVNLTEVTCPENRPAQAGDVFTCSATGEDGRILEITITQADDQGNVGWEVTNEQLPGE